MKGRIVQLMAGIILLAVWGCAGEPTQDNTYDPDNDRVRPAVLSVSPGDGDVAVSVNASVVATLSEDIDTLSITSDNVVLLDGTYNIVAGVISYSEREITFTPVEKMNHCQEYTMVLTDRIRDLAGNTLGDDYVSTFTTRISYEPQMVTVPGTAAGSPYSMGSADIAQDPVLPDHPDLRADAQPVHPVNIDTFLLGKTEVTFDQFDEFCVATGREKPMANFGRGFMPAVNVSWYDAVDYCNWLSDMSGYTKCYYRDGPVVKWVEDDGGSCDGFRLPTEAEWEYAAREAGVTDPTGYSGYWYGVPDEEDHTGDYAWHSGNSGGVTHEVAWWINPNQLGLFDMSGNVAEWCWDWYAAYDADEATNPHGPPDAVNENFRKVIRGGSWESWQSWWGNPNTSPYEIATGVRYNKRPVEMRSSLGFRVCRKYTGP